MQPAGRMLHDAGTEDQLHAAADARGRAKCAARPRDLTSASRTATSEARIVDADGKLYAHGTTTCIVVERAGLDLGAVMSEFVRYEVSDRVAVVTIDNPPVNALGAGVWEAIDEAVARAASDDRGADAIVLIGAGTTFIAGADIKVFEHAEDARAIAGRDRGDARAAAAPGGLDQAARRRAFTATRSAAASRWRRRATSASRPTTRGSASRKCCSASFPAPAARSGCRGCAARRWRSRCAPTASRSAAPEGARRRHHRRHRRRRPARRRDRVREGERAAARDIRKVREIVIARRRGRRPGSRRAQAMRASLAKTAAACARRSPPSTPSKPG